MKRSSLLAYCEHKHQSPLIGCPSPGEVEALDLLQICLSLLIGQLSSKCLLTHNSLNWATLMQKSIVSRLTGNMATQVFWLNDPCLESRVPRLIMNNGWWLSLDCATLLHKFKSCAHIEKTMSTDRCYFHIWLLYLDIF